MCPNIIPSNYNNGCRIQITLQQFNNAKLEFFPNKINLSLAVFQNQDRKKTKQLSIIWLNHWVSVWVACCMCVNEQYQKLSMLWLPLLYSTSPSTSSASLPWLTRESIATVIPNSGVTLPLPSKLLKCFQIRDKLHQPHRSCKQLVLLVYPTFFNNLSLIITDDNQGILYLVYSC